MVCSRGADETAFTASVTMPEAMPSGATFTVRIDSHPSGEISHFGLNYIHDMTTQYLLPRGIHFVEGSARVVPDTGTANVRTGARAWHEAARIYMTMPAHIANGASYTPPSLEFSAQIDAPTGSHVAVEFARYEVIANALVVGDVRTECEPTAKPCRLAMLRVEAPASR